MLGKVGGSEDDSMTAFCLGGKDDGIQKMTSRHEAVRTFV
jgi:hypothetical protein